MLTGGKWGEASCAHCGTPLGAVLKCRHCGFVNTCVDSIDILPSCVEKTPKSEQAETDTVPTRHRYAGSFGG